MSTSALFILSLIIIALLTLAIVLLMIKTNDLLATLRGHSKNKFVPLSVHLVKRRQMIEKRLQEISAESFADEKKDLLNTLRRACEAAETAEKRAISSRTGGFFSARLAPMEDAMIFALCHLIECLYNCDQPHAKRWIGELRQPLDETRERIEFALREFNESLEDFNKLRSSFPFILVAGMMGYCRVQLLHLKKVDC